MPLAIADMNERRDIASQVQQCVQLDRRLGRTERCPREYRQAQIDGGGIQSVNGVFQIDSKRLVGIKPSRHRDQTLCEVAVDAPVASCVGVGQGVARHDAADTQVIELGGLRAQTGFDVAQTLAKGQLRKGHRQVLIQTSEPLDLVMSTIMRHTATKSRQRQMFHQLRKHQLACMHQLPPAKIFIPGLQNSGAKFKSRPGINMNFPNMFSNLLTVNQ